LGFFKTPGVSIERGLFVSADVFEMYKQKFGDGHPIPVFRTRGERESARDEDACPSELGLRVPHHGRTDERRRFHLWRR
jgi:hypothetical protein